MKTGREKRAGLLKPKGKIKVKGILAAVLTGVYLLSFSGCVPSFSFSAEGTMRPPRPTGEKSEIYSVLETVAGNGFTLKYPGSGDYRSAIIMKDLNGDGQSEAVAFYQKADDTGISILFIQKAGETWQSLGGFTNTASQVDKVEFGDVNGDGNQEVVVGWGNAQASSTFLCVYSAEQGKMQEMNLDQSYSQMVVMDFDGDGFDEIFTANVALGEQAALSSLFRMRSGAIEIMDTAEMDMTVTRYINMSAGLLNDGQYGIVLDGARSNAGYVTEVVFWNEETHALEAPLLDPSQKAVLLTVRTSSALSRDVNDDTLIELPITTFFPGYTQQNAGETSYLTDWVHYNTAANTLERVMSAVTNNSDEYWFLVPDMWKGAITTEYDAERRSLSFYKWEEERPEQNKRARKGRILLQIRVFTVKQWASGRENAAGEYFKLAENNGLVYAARNYSLTGDLFMSDEDVQYSFRLVKQE